MKIFANSRKNGRKREENVIPKKGQFISLLCLPAACVLKALELKSHGS